MVVAGKYRVSGSSALPSFDALLDVVNYLVEMEYEQQKSVAGAAE
jgi:hypothetical protein